MIIKPRGEASTSAKAPEIVPDGLDPHLLVVVYTQALSSPPVALASSSGPAEAVAAWMRAYADRLAPTTRVRYHGIHPTHTNGETDR